MAYAMSEFHGAEEFRRECDNYLQELQEIAADFIADATAPATDEPIQITEVDLLQMSVDRGILSPGDWNDGNYDSVELGEKLNLNLVNEGFGSFWVARK